MRILMISKYPPIEGGVSSRVYWLAKALGERGAEISVVTNALEVEDGWREEINLKNINEIKKHQPKNVFFYSLEKKPPYHIPYSEAYLSRLVNLGLKAVAERGADVIYAHYLEPYASAGFVLKKITGLPLVIKHAGSDIYRLFKSEDFRYFLAEVMSSADALILSANLPGFSETMRMSEKKIHTPPPIAVDADAFSPKWPAFDFTKYGFQNPPAGIAVFAYFGKATPNKGIGESIKALSELKKDFRFVFVAKGKSAEKFAAEARGLLGGKFIHLPFIPPWEVPLLLRSASAALMLENNFPIPIHSPTSPYEAIATGTPIILSGEMFDKLKSRLPSSRGLFTVIDDPHGINQLSNVFRKIIASPESFRENAQKIREEFLAKNDWNGYVDFYFSLFAGLFGAIENFPYSSKIFGKHFFKRFFKI